ncbi:MAG: T9SS type A sorting domain-containing protein, partial [Saprospiraceae bacterium]
SNSIQFTINCSNNSTETELGQRVSRQNSKEENLFRFFPNPFSKGINLEMNSDIAESVALQAYNTVGTLMFERKIELLKGVNLRYIDAFENVPSGVYIVKIKSPTKDYTTKVIRVD